MLSCSNGHHSQSNGENEERVNLANRRAQVVASEKGHRLSDGPFLYIQNPK